MDIGQIEALAAAFLLEHPENRVAPEDAMREDLIGMQLYDAPVFAVASAADPLFASLKGPQVVHPDYRLPAEWLPEAVSVLSFFVPFTARVRKANAADDRQPADEWLHARYEGEILLKKLRCFLRDTLTQAGYPSVAPLHDDRYAMLAPYAPNWSERHTGYVCGLGTFSMSKGLITEKGVAGRIGSVVTACPLAVTRRAYVGVYERCIRCGACAGHCPVRAIDATRRMDEAKQHPPCDAFLAHVQSRPPRGQSGRQRYGCGKCQVGVPCEDRIPG